MRLPHYLALAAALFATEALAAGEAQGKKAGGSTTPPGMGLGGIR